MKPESSRSSVDKRPRSSVDFSFRKCLKTEIKLESPPNFPKMESHAGAVSTSLKKDELGIKIKQEVVDDEDINSISTASSGDSNSASFFQQNNAEEQEQATDIKFHQFPLFADEYRILEVIHEGSSAKLLECIHLSLCRINIIKVFHGPQVNDREASLREINILEKLAKHDNENKHFVHLVKYFDYHNNTCIEMTSLGPSLHSFMYTRNYHRVPLYGIYKLGRQMFQSVALMHDLGLIHTDLKPGHLLFASNLNAPCGLEPRRGYYDRVPLPFHLKVIDFTSTIHQDDFHKDIVSTRQYRAPEVILGLGWSFPCDVWSLGCILAELYFGWIIFKTNEDLEHLAMMQKVLGEFPSHMLEKTLHPFGKYDESGRLNLVENHNKAVMRLQPFENFFCSPSSESLADFVSLLQGLLKYDPSERLTAQDALEHPFLKKRDTCDDPYEKLASIYSHIYYSPVHAPT